MAEAEESPHIIAITKQWWLNNLAAQRKKIRIVGGKVETYTPPPPANDLETVVAAEKRAREGAAAGAEIGQMVEGHGVFIGTWQPEGLSQIFNVFASPEDLTDEDNNKELYTYDDTVERIAQLKNWNGFNGTNYKYDNDLYEALKDGSYIKEGSGWIIPPRELLGGTNNRTQQPDSLYTHKDKGVLSGSFITAASDSSGCPGQYWSSTAPSSTAPSNEDSIYLWTTDFSNGNRNWDNKIDRLLSCRPVRLELRP